MLCYDIFDSPIGSIIAASVDSGLCLLEFTTENNSSGSLESIALQLKEKPAKGRNIHLSGLNSELDGYFSGDRKSFTIPLVLTGTGFQKQVWNELLRIPYGETRSYSDQSLSIGKPDAIRAVARANGANPLSIIIPCHRVIGRNGKLTGYGGGLWRKKWLIEHENKNSGHPILLSLF